MGKDKVMQLSWAYNVTVYLPILNSYTCTHIRVPSILGVVDQPNVVVCIKLPKGIAHACPYLTKYSCPLGYHAILLCVVQILALHPMWLEDNNSSPLGRKTAEKWHFQSLKSPNVFFLDV